MKMALTNFVLQAPHLSSYTVRKHGSNISLYPYRKYEPKKNQIDLKKSNWSERDQFDQKRINLITIDKIWSFPRSYYFDPESCHDTCKLMFDPYFLRSCYTWDSPNTSNLIHVVLLILTNWKSVNYLKNSIVT